MSLKSTFHIILTVSVLLGSLGGIAHVGADLPVSSSQEQDSSTLSATPELSTPELELACIGCSGNGGGPG